MVGRTVNRRRHERFSLPPMYSALTVKVVGGSKSIPLLDGHCYDISESGVQFELDNALPDGTALELSIELPATLADRESRGPVRVLGNIIWRDESEPGPVRMAVAFSKFFRADDKDRLFRQITSGRLARAA